MRVRAFLGGEFVAKLSLVPLMISLFHQQKTLTTSVSVAECFVSHCTWLNIFVSFLRLQCWRLLLIGSVAQVAMRVAPGSRSRKENRLTGRVQDWKDKSRNGIQRIVHLFRLFSSVNKLHAPFPHYFFLIAGTYSLLRATIAEKKSLKMQCFRFCLIISENFNYKFNSHLETSWYCCLKLLHPDCMFYCCFRDVQRWKMRNFTSVRVVGVLCSI